MIQEIKENPDDKIEVAIGCDNGHPYTCVNRSWGMHCQVEGCDVCAPGQRISQKIAQQICWEFLQGLSSFEPR